MKVVKVAVATMLATYMTIDQTIILFKPGSHALQVTQNGTLSAATCHQDVLAQATLESSLPQVLLAVASWGERGSTTSEFLVDKA